MNPPKWERKAWGLVCHEFYNDEVGLSRLLLDEEYRCSRHYHEERSNQFTVIEGSVCIERWPIGLDKPKKMKVLAEGDSAIVSAGIFHRFRVIRGGSLIELYWPNVVGGKVRFNDIIRYDKGGPDDPAELERELKERGLV